MSDSEQELARDLGFLEAYTIGLGTMIGAGIFVLPSIAAEQAGPASMVSFFAGGLVSLLAALSLSELATGMPKAGGSYYYVNRALGPFFGSIVGWGMWAGLTFASAFYMIGFGQYLLPGLGQYVGFLSGWGQLGITVAALVMAALLTGVNYYGVKETGALQNVIVLTLVGLILAFLGLGIVSEPTIQNFNPNGWPAVAATIGTVYVTFIGFEVIATSAEEIKNPSRNLPLAMIAAVVTPTLMYVGVMYVSTGTLSIGALATSQIPVADVATEFMGSLGALLMIVGAVLATVSSANASILSAARVNFAMGRDRILVNWLNEVHNRFRTPYRAISATGVVTLVLIAVGVGVGTLAEVASFMYLVTYALVHIAVVVLRRADPETYNPAFEIPSVLYPIVPILGFVACLAILVQMSFIVQAVGSVIIVFGVLWYFFYARDRALSESLVGEAIAPKPTPMASREVGYRVVVPVANPETERDLLRMAAASAHAHEDVHAEIIVVNVIEVPRQTSLSQDLAFEEERVERQRELLNTARNIAADLDIGLQTRAIAGRNAGPAILDVIEEENADHVVLGWQGTRSRHEHILGSTIDPVIGRAPCDATLVKLGPEDGRGEGDIMVLAGGGPHAPIAARRAAEFVAAADDESSLTLFNVQSPETDGDEDVSPTKRGEAVISELVERAGIEYMSYETRVAVAEDTEQTILEAAEEYDTICVGATRSGAISQAVFGSLPETIGEEVSQTVVMARGPEESPMSVRQALLQRLEV
ncbi:putative cationic amino acid transport protein [Halogeometricum pallidum JCM 14848]|uniref:Putative cationic amino acid transport protein n=1 Tax=Halogeometricum pallidum JCM 14848 TaxID=1227487 RepID=M0DAH1_HALPD|nr:amino acid permease [Halogeometricum pallidum]ELZ32446.1 putative cationic amino acid transport protein [Halogeometricum pallidum JCM 14848]